VDQSAGRALARYLKAEIERIIAGSRVYVPA
jgi:hypothetical protein